MRNGDPGGDHAAYAPTLLVLNSRTCALAASQEIRCADLESEFKGGTTLFEADGFHPNDAGTQIMALAFTEQF